MSKKIVNEPISDHTDSYIYITDRFRAVIKHICSDLGIYPPKGGSTLIDKEITENGVYVASADGADGYRKIIINVPTSEVVVTEETLPNGGIVKHIHTTPIDMGDLD